MSPVRLPVLKAREVLRALGRAGFIEHRSSGSHRILKHPAKPGLRVTVPFHSGDLRRSTLESIIGESGLTVQEFLKLL